MMQRSKTEGSVTLSKMVGRVEARAESAGQVVPAGEEVVVVDVGRRRTKGEDGEGGRKEEGGGRKEGGGENEGVRARRPESAGRTRKREGKGEGKAGVETELIGKVHREALLLAMELNGQG